MGRSACSLTAGAFAVAVLTSSIPVYGQAWSPAAAVNHTAPEFAGGDVRPDAATDGAGVWVAVWYSDETFGGTIGGDYDILFARSADNGASWADAAPLNVNAAIDSGGDVDPKIATDGAGVWITVWRSTDSLGDTIGGDPDVLFAVSTDDALTWSAPAPLNGDAAADAEGDLDPAIATDGAGVWLATWSTTSALGVATGVDQDLLYVRSTNNGTTWEPLGVLNTNAEMDGSRDESPVFAPGGAGRWTAAWHAGGSPGNDWDILFAVSADGGLSWSAPGTLNSTGASDDMDDLYPHIAADGAGTVVAVWDRADDLKGDGFNRSMYTARSTNHGVAWSEAKRLGPQDAPGFGSFGHVATDGANTWIAVWHSLDSLGGTIGTDADIVASESTDNGATWSAPAPVNSFAAADPATDVYPFVGSDGTGSWLTLWESDQALDFPDFTLDFDILFSRKSTGGNPADINEDGFLNAIDVQAVINAVLGVGTFNGDANGDGDENAADIQLVINAVLGLE